MNDIDYQEIEQLKYIKKSSHLLSKLHLDELDSISNLTINTRECILLIDGVRKMSDRGNLVVENIKPVILDLEQLKKKLKQMSRDLASIEYTFNLLAIICKASQNLTDKLNFIVDVDTGIFGMSDHISRGNFDFEKMYYFSEKNFEVLMLNIYLLITQFERKGETKSGKKDETSGLIKEVIDLIEIVIFLSEKCLPFTLFIRRPKVFEKCNYVGVEIESKLQMVFAAQKIIKLRPLVDKAIIELDELAERYKRDSDKKISLDPLFNKKDGAEKLGNILKKAKRFTKLL